MGTINLGVDVGGTFTDFILLNSKSGEYRSIKLPTTIHDRSEAFVSGIQQLGVEFEAIDWLVHGTTAGTNAILERKGARCALITTRGFRDILELGRRTRPNAYGLSGTFEPLIERRYRFEVDERIDAKGQVVTELNEEQVKAVVQELQDLGIESVVIHFLHSYVNPEHERRCSEIVRSLWHNKHVVAGHELIREVREFERGSTAAIHGLIRPVVTEYIERVAERINAHGFKRQLWVMQANGGMMDSSVVGSQAVQTVMSGPAAGVLAAAEIAKAAGLKNVITADMGGTSYDVALVSEGEPVITAEKDLAYSVPLRVPIIDIHSIGSGGGSIAHVDAAGMLRVGPESAGSFPGPISYGHGGDQPTITDANVLLGRIDVSAFSTLKQEGSLQTVAELFEQRVGQQLGLDAIQTAAAILRVAVHDLAGAIRLISLDKGLDPRDFSLMPYGGAGPLHAVAIARELGIPRVVVPRFPGITSALGCVLADVRHDYVQTINQPLREIDPGLVEQIMTEHLTRGRELLTAEGVLPEAMEHFYEADLLFRGQSHVLTVPIRTESFDPEVLLKDFEQLYLEQFELRFPEMVPMLVNLRTSVIGKRERLDLSIFKPTGSSLEAARKSRRKVYFDGQWLQTDIYDRDLLPLHAQLSGPVIIEQSDSTVVVDPGASCQVDELGNLILVV